MEKRMIAMPIDWIYHNEVYGIDANYDVWNLEKEKRVYHEEFTGDYSLKDILNNKVHWNNDPDESLYTIEDWLTDFDMEQVDREKWLAEDEEVKE